MEEVKSCCFTGYRPQKFPFSLDDTTTKEYKKFENKLIDAVFSLPDEGCYTFYCGMAMGFDIIAAETVLLLQTICKKATVSLICAVPFKGQANSFNKEWKSRYDEVISKADSVVLVSDEYHQGCYAKRNKFMVDNSDFVITWFDGKPGGTANTLKYAKEKGKRIININEYACHEYI